MRANDIVPAGHDLQSVVVELDTPSPWLCTTCFEPFETRASGGRVGPQLCACGRKREPARRWGPGPVLHLRLCRCCGLVPLGVGARGTSWFCPACLVDVLQVNARVGRDIVPVASATGDGPSGILVRGERETMAAALRTWLGAVMADHAARELLLPLRHARLRRLLERCGHGTARRVRLATFLRKAAAVRDEDLSRVAAVTDLLRAYGLRRWRSGAVTEAVESPETDDWGNAVEVGYAAICPVCGGVHACEHLVLTYDATFPGEPVNGRLEFSDVRRVFEAGWSLLAAERRAHPDEREADLLARLDPQCPSRLRHVVRAVLADHELEEADPECPDVDGYVVNAHLSHYLEAVLLAGPGEYVGQTAHEDRTPMASSSYGSFWARDGAAAAEAALAAFADDAAHFEALRRAVR